MDSSPHPTTHLLSGRERFLKVIVKIRNNPLLLQTTRFISLSRHIKPLTVKTAIFYVGLVFVMFVNR